MDTALRVLDKHLVTIARYVRDEDGLVLGSSSALNVAGALHTALQMGPGKRIVTFACDLGERSFSKLWNPEYLETQKLTGNLPSMSQLVAHYYEQALG